jgi:hypothetical protein
VKWFGSLHVKLVVVGKWVVVLCWMLFTWERRNEVVKDELVCWSPFSFFWSVVHALWLEEMFSGEVWK